jgi:hypothetical protein
LFSTFFLQNKKPGLLAFSNFKKEQESCVSSHFCLCWPRGVPATLLFCIPFFFWRAFFFSSSHCSLPFLFSC